MKPIRVALKHECDVDVESGEADGKCAVVLRIDSVYVEPWTLRPIEAERLGRALIKAAAATKREGG